MMGKQHVIRKFSTQWLLEVLFDMNNDADVVVNEIIDVSRWSIHHDFVFKIVEDGQDRFYRATYMTGATEYQSETPWQYEDVHVACYEVEPVQYLVTKFKELEV